MGRDLKSLKREKILKLGEFLKTLNPSKDKEDFSLKTTDRKLMGQLEALNKQNADGILYEVYYDSIEGLGIHYKDWEYSIAILAIDYKNRKVAVYRIKYQNT